MLFFRYYYNKIRDPCVEKYFIKIIAQIYGFNDNEHASNPRIVCALITLSDLNN